MEHYNPILGSETSGQKFITCGEIMLRLTPPNYEKIRMASSFEASYGGSEANIALALANLGVDSTFFSVVPNNSLGKSAVRWLRSNDVHCTPMILTEPDETPSNRLGTYYLETGYGIRASKVIYDRKHSVITEYDFSQVDLDALLDGFDWLHLSGITPALAPNCRGLIIDMLKTAKKKGLTVSFDGNFRSTLWSWEEARDFCTECLPYVDVLLGIEPYHLWKDETDHSKGDWKDGVPLQPSYEQQDEIFHVRHPGQDARIYGKLPQDERAVHAVRHADQHHRGKDRAALCRQGRAGACPHGVQEGVRREFGRAARRSQPQKADGNAAARRDGGGSRALRPAARLHHIKQREFLTAYPPFSGEKSK